MPVPATESIVLLSSSEEVSGGRGGGVKEARTGTASKSKNTGEKMATEKKRKRKADESRSSRGAVPASSSSSTPVWKSDGIMNSSCSFPMSRVRRLVVGSEGERRGGSGIRPSHEAVFLVNKAAEFFLELFAEDAYACAKREQNKSLLYNHLTSNVHTKKRYEFLSDFVPEKIKADDAMKARELSHND